MDTGPAWYARTREGEALVYRAYESVRHPAEALVDVEGEAEDACHLVWTATVDPEHARVARVVVAPAAARGAPAMWYVTLDEPAAEPPALNLVAFTAPLLADGTVIDDRAFARIPVRNDEQVASIRWWPSTGVIHQIYVAPRHRRRHIGRKLAIVAAGYSAAMGWPLLRAGGARTDLGEALARHADPQWQHRIAPRSAVMAPMTPEGQARGLPDRLLYPDPD